MRTRLNPRSCFVRQPTFQGLLGMRRIHRLGWDAALRGRQGEVGWPAKGLLRAGHSMRDEPAVRSRRPPGPGPAKACSIRRIPHRRPGMDMHGTRAGLSAIWQSLARRQCLLRGERLACHPQTMIRPSRKTHHRRGQPAPSSPGRSGSDPSHHLDASSPRRPECIISPFGECVRTSRLSVTSPNLTDLIRAGCTENPASSSPAKEAVSKLPDLRYLTGSHRANSRWVRGKPRSSFRRTRLCQNCWSVPIGWTSCL